MSDETPTFHLIQSPSHLLHRSLQLALDLYAEQFKNISLTQRQLSVLVAVSKDEGLSQTDLVAATGIDRSTLAEMVSRMVEKDLLVRSKSASDGRAKVIKLSEVGAEILADALPRVRAVDDAIMATLPRKKLREKFLLALQHLAHVVEEAEGVITLDDGKKKKKSKKKDKDKKGKKAKVKKKAKKKKKDTTVKIEIHDLSKKQDD